MFSLYVPLYETDEPTIKSELATFFQAFPNGTVWATPGTAWATTWFSWDRSSR